MSATTSRRCPSAGQHSADYCRLVELSPLPVVTSCTDHRRLSPQLSERHSRRSSPRGNDVSPCGSSTSGSYRGSDGSPTARIHPGTPRHPQRSPSYTSCSNNHGIRPPLPEQYLTPLQQKEVCIRHLRERLRDNLEKLQDRDAEVEELRAQLWRMQEDWVEEECQRVEVQLALKEAQREVQQLQRVVESVRPLLVSGGASRCGSESGGSPARVITRSSTYTKLSYDQEADGEADGLSGEDTQDSGFVGDGSRADLLLEAFLAEVEDRVSLPRSYTYEKVGEAASLAEVCGGSSSQPCLLHLHPCQCEQAVQTDTIFQTPSPASTLFSGEGEHESFVAVATDPLSNSCVVNLGPSTCQPSKMSSTTSAEGSEEVETEEESAPPVRSYWSWHYLLDLLAVSVPVLPAVAWLWRRGPCLGGLPVCNISSLMRGCCAVALHSLRNAERTGGRVREMGEASQGGNMQI